MRGIFFAHCVARTFQQGTIAFQRLNNFLYFSFQLVLDLVKSIMNIPTKTTYVTSFPKRNDITGAPDLFKIDNFLVYLTGGIRAKTIAAIGTINPGSLCIQYLFTPQIHYDLSGSPIAFIGNSSNKKGKFSTDQGQHRIHPRFCVHQRQGNMDSRSYSWRRHSC